MKDILVTLGPATLSAEVIQEIDQFNVRCFRINMSHTNVEDLPKVIDTIRSASDTPICIDSEGAQMRTVPISDGAIQFEEGARVRIPHNGGKCDKNCLSFTPRAISRHFKVGDIVNVDFNLVSIRIEEVGDEECIGSVLATGAVGSCKAADAGRYLPLDPITDKDRQAIAIGRELGISMYALSFANAAQDVRAFRELIGEGATLISKIESINGLQDISNILEATDEILIDRGDLSRQVSIERIPFLQRRIISIARVHSTPVHVATNLLESMMMNKVPTRAEVNDIASTLLMGADGLVLAAETAVGDNPVQAVRTARTMIDYVLKWSTNANIDDILAM